MSAVQFQRQLGLTRYEPAFGILHKPRAGMVRSDQDRIGGQGGEHVELDETYVRGRTRGEGRGIHHKTLVTAAVEVRRREPGTAQDKRKDGRYAGRVRLSVADDIAERLAACIVDPRDQSRVIHGKLAILRASMLAIACGYENANDLDTLRHDQGFKLALGKCPEGAVGLASQP